MEQGKSGGEASPVESFIPHRNASKRFGGKVFATRFRCFKGREPISNQGPLSVQSILFIPLINKTVASGPNRFSSGHAGLRDKIEKAFIRGPARPGNGRGSGKTSPDLVLDIMAQGTTNEVLLARVADHDEGALGELFDRLAPGILGLLVHILPDRAMAEEVLQEVFLRFWVDARRWSREHASVPAALVLVARARAVERLRAGRSNAARPSRKDEAGPKFHSWLPRPEEIGLLDGRRDLFKKVINQLPKPQREMLDLAVFEGYTETELAEKLGEPLAKVRSGLVACVGFVRHRLAAVLRTWAANI